jgi:signal transduction histidine kinase
MEDNCIAKEYLLEIKKGLNRIANTTKSLLEFSRQVNNKSLQVKKYADVHKLIDESLDILKDRLSEDIRVNKKYKKSIPAILDFGLQHVMINILKNALDAISSEGIIDISTDIKDSMLEISFKDNGTGIPFEIREYIFEPFFTTKPTNKGTGLGLSISKEIVSQYEGRIEVKSVPGGGSDFTILIPTKYLENA